MCLVHDTGLLNDGSSYPEKNPGTQERQRAGGETYTQQSLHGGR